MFDRKRSVKKIVIGEQRKSQLLTTFGCGAIADYPNNSVIIAGLESWSHASEKHYRVCEENLQKICGVDYFVKPKVTTSSENSTTKSNFDMQVFRFPEMLVCSNCHEVKHYTEFRIKNNADPVCFKCSRGQNSKKARLIPSRFIIGCEKGHLDEFPYSYWVHRGDPIYEQHHKICIRYDEHKSGLEGIIIECKEPGCGRIRNMGGAFDKNALKGYRCKGKRPWLNDIDPVVCDCEQPRTLQRGASNVYFPQNISAISIPPCSSSRMNEEVQKYWEKLDQYVDNIPKLEVLVDVFDIHKRCNCSIEEVIKFIIKKANHEKNNNELTPEKLVENEYDAFLQGNVSEDHFRINEGIVPEVFKPYIQKVVLARKLREVLVLTGFSRIKASNENIAPLSKQPLNWLPGIELFGEGLFIQLKEEKLREWESKIGNRYLGMKNRMDDSMYRTNKFSPRYVLLHTLSHLLMRQFILDCGYSGAAIKERIYSTFEESDKSMCGILIYTATPDSDGSLGGLVRQGEEERLDKTLRNMLENASWCSNDPLCIDSKEQGVDGLNMAACHACTLTPETACEKGNVYLDRASVVGIIESPELGYFNEILHK
ncbi:DUF1998 domain-containing protein [Cellulosilyticum sp. ST5]|uniref:DrmB family protein n=1 Tax=Cellulosilyticum sp. ST5 TaxID=3055805 RepID=UPI003977D8A8